MRIPLLNSISDSLQICLAPDRNVKPQSIGVVISTYNNPVWLEKTLWGYFAQDFHECPLEIVIADDGSTHETRDLIDHYRNETGWNIRHVWHEDVGFRKCTILNRAIRESSSEYLIFTDHDCVPEPEFVKKHYQYAAPGFFISGRYSKIPRVHSENLTREDIQTGRAFCRRWLVRNGFFRMSLMCPVQPLWFCAIRNVLTTTRATWNGANSSGWKKDLVAINGFNEDMEYGGLDVELGCRLENLGIRARQVRYSIFCLHLDHDRPYRTPETLAKNRKIIRNTCRKKIVRAPHGLE
ncbi:MAG: glycosyltransferase family 2 protein [Planctomycetia bacterium]|nr:glycosyltransferase family 2 protein [Planctomycetia bacterium]